MTVPGVSVADCSANKPNHPQPSRSRRPFYLGMLHTVAQHTQDPAREPDEMRDHEDGRALLHRGKRACHDDGSIRPCRNRSVEGNHPDGKVDRTGGRIDQPDAVPGSPIELREDEHGLLVQGHRPSSFFSFPMLLFLRQSMGWVEEGRRGAGLQSQLGPFTFGLQT